MSGGDEDPFVRSQADLMAGVAGVFFVLMAIFLAISLKHSEALQRQAELLEKKDKLREQENQGALLNNQNVDNGLRGLRDDLKKLKEELLKDKQCELSISNETKDAAAGGRAFPEVVVDVRGASVDRDGGVSAERDGGVSADRDGGVSFNFGEGGRTLSAKQDEAAKECIARVLQTVCARSSIVWHILFEGHTNNNRLMSGKDPFCQDHPAACSGDAGDRLQHMLGANLELSAARAVYLLRLALRDDPNQRACVESKLLIGGRGPLSPVDAGAGDWTAPQDKAEQVANRRVRIRVIGAMQLLREPSIDGGAP